MLSYEFGVSKPNTMRIWHRLSPQFHLLHPNTPLPFHSRPAHPHLTPTIKKHKYFRRVFRNPSRRRDLIPPDAFQGKEMPIANKKEEDDASLKRSNTMIKKLVPKVLRTNSMKNLFKSKRPRAPVDVVRETRALLLYIDSAPDDPDPKRNDKLAHLDINIRELKSILYGIEESEPVPDACAQVTQEFFADDTMRLLILCLPKLNFEARKDATRVVANLQRQQVHSRLIGALYLEDNLDLMDILLTGYEDPVLALHYGAMLRECIRHQVVAKYILQSPHMRKFFDYIQLPNFDVASDAANTFKELMTRHKSTVAEFLKENYTWFFDEFNSKLVGSSNYVTRRNAVKLLGDILLDRSNSGVMIRYVSSKDNMRVLMTRLREDSKCIQIDAFHVFKLFVANQNKPADIVNILCANKDKLLRFLDDFNVDKEDATFEADKAQLIKEIWELAPATPLNSGSGESFKSTIVV